MAKDRARTLEMAADAEDTLTRYRINWDCILDRLAA